MLESFSSRSKCRLTMKLTVDQQLAEVQKAMDKSVKQAQFAMQVAINKSAVIAKGTPLSLSELQHGVNAGIISSTLLR